MDSYMVNVIAAEPSQELLAIAGGQGTKAFSNVTIAGVNQHRLSGFRIFQFNKSHLGKPLFYWICYGKGNDVVFFIGYAQ